MITKMKSFSHISLILGIFINFALTGCRTNSEGPKVAPENFQAFVKLTVDDIQNASNPMQWQMVWVDDFGINEITNVQLKNQLETFIKLVKVTTMEIDGRLVTAQASTVGCWSITYETRRRIITPARTEEKIQQDGNVEYDVTPATYKHYVDRVAVGGACTYHPKIEGKVYNLNWYEPMHDFLSLNFQQAVNRIEGNMLEWVGPNGKTIARFEERPVQKNFREF